MGFGSIASRYEGWKDGARRRGVGGAGPLSLRSIFSPTCSILRKAGRLAKKPTRHGGRQLAIAAMVTPEGAQAIHGLIKIMVYY